jgi:hypothetical protein
MLHTITALLRNFTGPTFAAPNLAQRDPDWLLRGEVNIINVNGTLPVVHCLELNF